MKGKIIVSGGGKLRLFGGAKTAPSWETPLAGSGALCAGGGWIFAASDEENAVYRFRQDTLLPKNVLAGGPGMRAMCLSRCGRLLFVLASDADSVLMLGAQDGVPLRLARVGVCPQSLRLDDTGRYLVIAGGRDGCAHLLCARTLKTVHRETCGGFCADAVCRGGRIRTLCMCADRAAPGRLIAAGAAQMFIDPLTERLYARENGGKWRLVCAAARDAAFLSHAGRDAERG